MSPQEWTGPINQGGWQEGQPGGPQQPQGPPQQGGAPPGSTQQWQQQSYQPRPGGGGLDSALSGLANNNMMLMGLLGGVLIALVGNIMCIFLTGDAFNVGLMLRSVGGFLFAGAAIINATINHGLSPYAKMGLYVAGGLATFAMM
ncbi:MAG: hypothetical protein QCI38_05170 [Candidatus Thermoplasmatota archaeon]|nr:hypothetical protein [Candidatus Thermoplasmatota archaeon]